MDFFNNNIEFCTERLCLRLLLPEDIDAIMNYYIVNKECFEGIIPYYKYKFNRDFFLKLLNAELSDFLDNRSVRFYLFDRSGKTDDIWGDFSIFDIRRGLFQNASLGFKLGSENRNKGLMREALRFAIDYAFSTLGLHRLEVQTSVCNNSAVRLVEHLGFDRIGIAQGYIKINADWEDYYLYSLLNTKD
jgi:ribosomal-protein-alanine N-acetyltransferase